MPALRVIGIEVCDVLDLLRLHVNVKGEKPGLMAYKNVSNNKYFVGFYLPSFLKHPKLAFIHCILDREPPKLYSFEFNNIETYKVGYSALPSAINIPISFISMLPHEYTDEIGDQDSHSFIKVFDIRSLVIIAHSIYFELAEIPYIWYDINRDVYVLNVFITDHEHAGNMFFYVEGMGYKGPYLYLDEKYDEVKVDSSPKRVEKKYVQVIRVKNLPYIKEI